MNSQPTPNSQPRINLQPNANLNYTANLERMLLQTLQLMARQNLQQIQGLAETNLAIQRLIQTLVQPPMQIRLVFEEFLNPVEVSQHTTVRPFQEMENPLNVDCPICQTPFAPEDSVMRINACGHLFHRDELTTWFQRHTNCPVCRHELRPATEEHTQDHINRLVEQFMRTFV